MSTPLNYSTGVRGRHRTIRFFTAFRMTVTQAFRMTERGKIATAAVGFKKVKIWQRKVIMRTI